VKKSFIGRFLIINIHFFFNNTTKHYSKFSEVKRIGSMVVQKAKDNKTKVSAVTAGVALLKNGSNRETIEDQQWAVEENQRQTKVIEAQVFKMEREQYEDSPLVHTINEIKTILKCPCHLVGDNSKIYQTASIEFDKLKKTLKDQLDSVKVLNLKFQVQDPLKSIIDENNDPFDTENPLSSFSKLLERIKEFQREESKLQNNFLKDFRITLSEMYRELDSKDSPICIAKLKQINGRWEKKPEKHESFFSSTFTVITLGVFLNDSSMGVVSSNESEREQFFVGFSAIKTSEPIASAILQILFNELSMDIEAIKESLENLKCVDVIPFFTSVFNPAIRQGNRDLINAKISKISGYTKKEILKQIKSFGEINQLKKLKDLFNFLKQKHSEVFQMNTGDHVDKNDPFYQLLKDMEANNSLWRLMLPSTTKDN
jgi:hypothetical protein